MAIKERSWEEIQKFLLEDREFHDERYLVRFIKRHLLTEKHQTMLNKYGLSISDCLNGECGETGQRESTSVEKMFKDWNKKIGFEYFSL